MAKKTQPYWKLDDTSYEVARLRGLLKETHELNKIIKKDHRRLERENAILRARLARVELLGDIG